MPLLLIAAQLGREVQTMLYHSRESEPQPQEEQEKQSIYTNIHQVTSLISRCNKLLIPLLTQTRRLVAKACQAWTEPYNGSGAKRCDILLQRAFCTLHLKLIPREMLLTRGRASTRVVLDSSLYSCWWVFARTAATS